MISFCVLRIQNLPFNIHGTKQFELTFLLICLISDMWISMKHTCMRWPWTSCMREFFPCLSIASVDGKQHLNEVVFSALRFSLMTVIWFPGCIRTPRTRYQWLWCSWGRAHCLWSPTCPGCICMTWKSNCFIIFSPDESTKHYLTQMLLVINWRYWQAGKKFMHVYEYSRSLHASALHWNPLGFHEKKHMVRYFSNRVVWMQNLPHKTTLSELSFL